MRTMVKMLLTHRQNSYMRRSREVGMTLVEILVVIAIIAALAAIIYPAVMDSLKKSQAAMIAQRIDAVQKAKVQYGIDTQTNAKALPNDTDQVQFSWIQPYLTRFGMEIGTWEELSQGTGGTVNLGVWGSNPYFTAASGVSSNQYIAAYHIPTSSSPPSGSGN